MVRRAPIGLLTAIASAALHGLALWALGTAVPAQPAERSRPLELAWFESERPVETQPRPAEPQPAASVRPAAKRPAPSSKHVSGTPSAPATEGAKATSSGGVATLGHTGDVPVAGGVQLTPGLERVFTLAAPSNAAFPRGTTVRNGPGEEPDPVAALEFQGEVLTRRLTGELQQELGAAAVAVGAVPGHFRSVESSMREALRGGAGVETTAKSAGQVARDVARLLLASPGISPEAARKVTDSPLGRSMAAGTVPLPNADEQRFREQAMQMMGAGEALKEKLSAPQLRTVLELTCDSSGAVADVTVVEKSGDPRFDESVLHLSRKVFRSLPENDDKGLGSSWWRTRWQFTWEPPAVKVRLMTAHRVPPT